MKIELENAVLYAGSNLDVLPTLPDNSVDSIVTDPPYELGFMGKSWDNSGIAYSVELWSECMRVLKPGGHLLAFGGSRTWHRLAVAIEDAGFEMRDSIAWLYGSGFPKSMDISKQIDKQAGAEREIISSEVSRFTSTGRNQTYGKLDYMATENGYEIRETTAPATPEAQKWEGWGTALKPAFEPVVVARKPLIGTVAANVLAYGTGGLNIDASRIGTEERTNQPAGSAGLLDRNSFPNCSQAQTVQGRWPANIILDPYTAELLDEQSGISTSPNKCYSGGSFGSQTTYAQDDYTQAMLRTARPAHGDSGGASRFFYVAKASKKDRNEGLEELPEVQGGSMSGGEDMREGKPTNHPMRQNFHPTVKPTSLMEYLIKLVTPEGGTVLDPFTGSGSTGKAALLNGYQFIGIELTDEYLPIIEGRLKWANEQASQKEEEKNEVLF
jgi:site-specific DNA-methyltransferase (adenine-specific)